MSTVMEAPAPTRTRPQDLFARNFFQLRVAQHLYAGQHVLPNVETMVQGQLVEAGKVTKPRTQLIPAGWLARFREAFRPVGPLLDRTTIPMRIREDVTDAEDASSGTGRTSLLALRILPMRAQQEVFTELVAVRERVRAVVRELQDAWETEVVAVARADWTPKLGVEGCQRWVLSRLPKRSDLPYRYRLSWQIFQVSPADISHVSDLEMRAQLAEARDAAQEQLTAAMDAILTEPRQRLVEAMDQLRRQLAEGTRVSSQTFTDINAAIRLVQSFGDASEQELLRQLNTLQRTVNDMVEAGEGRANGESYLNAIAGHRSTFNQLAERVATQCSNSAAIDAARNRYGVRARPLIIDDEQ